jgi:hypothetical protein
MPGQSQSQQPWNEAPPAPAGYDPNNPTPYTAPQLPEMTPPPTRPQQETQQPQQSPTGPQVARSGGGIASAAFMLDSILKGAMRGREQAQQVNFYKAKKLNDGLRYAYEATAQQYTAAAQHAAQVQADPSSTPEQKSQAQAEMQKADAAQRAAYQSWRQMQNNYLMGDQKPKKSSKSKGGGQSQGNGDGSGGEDPMTLITSKDPKEKLRGISMLQDRMYQKYGTPANVTAQQWFSPEYQQQLKLYRGQQSAAGRAQDTQTRFDELEKKEREGSLTDPEKSELQIAKEQRYQTAGKVDKKVDSYTGADGKRHDVWMRPDGTRYESASEGDVRAPVSQGPGTLQDFISRTAKEAGIDVKDLSAQSMLDLEKAFKAGGTPVRTSQRQYVYTDKATGDIHVVPLTSTTGPAGGGSAAKVPAVHKAGESGAASGTAGTPSTSTSASTSTSTPTASGKDQYGGHVIGHTLSQPQAKSQATTNDTYKKMKPLFGLLDAQEQYMNEVKADPSKASPRQDLSLVVAAVRAMNPGSVRLPQKELELEIKAGSFHDQAARWYEKASTGLLPEDQRNDLFGIVQRETTKAGESIAADWQQYMSGQPLPSDLKRFAKDGGGSGGSGGGSADEHTIVDSKGNEIKVKVVKGKWVNSATGQPIQ